MTGTRNPSDARQPVQAVVERNCMKSEYGQQNRNELSVVVNSVWSFHPRATK
jgi:hypothetical protein